MTKTEDLGPKEKPIFYRRKKNGEIITNDPNLKKAAPDAEKKASLDAAETQPDEVWFDDVDPVLLDVAEKGLMGGSDAEDALVKAKSFTGLTKVCILSVTDIQNNCLFSRCLEWTVRW